MKIKVKNITGADKSFQINGYDSKTVKPGEIVEREFRDEQSIPEGWEIVKKTSPTAGNKTTGKPPVVITENHIAPIVDNAGVTTSAALKGII